MPLPGGIGTPDTAAACSLGIFGVFAVLTPNAAAAPTTSPLEQPHNTCDLSESVFQHPQDFVARLTRVRRALRRDRAIDGVTQCAQSV